MTDIKEVRKITTKEETDLIKSTFKDNDALLKKMRALFLGLPLTDVEKGMVKLEAGSPDMIKILRQRFLPTIEKDAQIGTISDVWLGVESMVYGQNPDTIEQSIKYKEKALAMTEQALALLENPDGTPVDISYSPEKFADDALQINLLARNQFIRHIEQQLLFLQMIAQQEDENPEDRKNRVAQNSSK